MVRSLLTVILNTMSKEKPQQYSTREAFYERLVTPGQRIGNEPVPGVSQKTHDVLQLAIVSGVFHKLTPDQQFLLDVYYGTDISTVDMKDMLTLSTASGVSRRIRKVFKKIYQQVVTKYPEIKEEYPLEETVKLKEKHTSRSRNRRSVSLKETWRRNEGKPFLFRGRHHTEKTKQTLREKNIGRVLSKEAKS